MGCFLQCFGLSKKRKRRKTLYKVLAAAAAADQNHGNYEALDSSLSVNLAITENPTIPSSNFSDEYKEKTRVKSRKKVSFNLNVQIYEPNPTDYQILESDEEEEEEDKEEGNREMGKSSSSSSILGEKSEALKYPSNHRYYSYINSYNEEDEIVDEESDIDAYDDDDEFDEEGGWYDGNDSEEEDWAEVYNENTVQKQSCEPKYSSLEKERSKNHQHSVLSPVENLTQWKAIKAKVAPSKQGRKENVPLEQKTGFNLLESKVLQSKPLLSEIAVDASFSNWCISPNVSKTTIHCQ